MIIQIKPDVWVNSRYIRRVTVFNASTGETVVEIDVHAPTPTLYQCRFGTKEMAYNFIQTLVAQA